MSPSDHLHELDGISSLGWDGEVVRVCSAFLPPHLLTAAAFISAVLKMDRRALPMLGRYSAIPLTYYCYFKSPALAQTQKSLGAVNFKFPQLPISEDIMNQKKSKFQEGPGLIADTKKGKVAEQSDGGRHREGALGGSWQTSL